jgi:hypothetical protein
LEFDVKFLVLAALPLFIAAPAGAQSMPGMEMPAAKPAPPPPHDMQGMNMGGDRGRDLLDGVGVADPYSAPAALGPYPINREASGTAWQPDTTPHQGIHLMAGKWMLMGHALVNGVYDWQEGPRGGEKVFISGMLMGMAVRHFADGSALQFKAMLSPDPLMGARGYPLLLAAGETANGRDRLVDRQHPHDLFMELSASYSVRLGGDGSLFVYGGLPGEPAFGPPAFMHRLSILDSPEAPISHHWLDSTHISFGVLTAGATWRGWKVEASRFNGREPDQHRYDIETGPVDSTSLRLSWNPSSELSFQASWAHLESPEQLEPDVDQTRWSASAIYTRRLGEGRWWSTTLAWGRRSSGGKGHDAVALESALALGKWTLFGRMEYAENDELAHGPAFGVGKVSVGAIRDFRLAPHLKLGIGALAALDFVPRPLDALYAGDPKGAMAFVRLKVD